MSELVRLKTLKTALSNVGVISISGYQEDLCMATPRVSIVIPAYNREGFIGGTIESVCAQTFSDWQLVIFDDGSKDATKAVAQSYADADSRIRVLSGPNGGVASARNRGLAATDAGSEFVIFLDSDDLWFPNSLESLVRELDAQPDLVSVYGLARCVDAAGLPVPGDDLEERMKERVEYKGRDLVDVETTQPTSFAGLVYHNWVITPGIHLIRRVALQQVGEFDRETDPADDWDFVVRLSRFGDIGFADQVVLQWRRHPGTLTSTSPRWKSAYFRVRRKMLIHPGNTREQTRLARIGYSAPTGGLLRDAKASITQHDFRAGARQFAKAIDWYLRYLSVAIPDRGRRLAGRHPV